MPAPRRVAVIGAGPSGLYATAALLAADVPVEVDVLDRLPAPFGLVRYGVAPDHVRMKSVMNVLRKPFASGSRARFLGNVHIGGDGGMDLPTLRRHYHAVIHASGSSVERDLGIAGEDLDGSHGSRAFVNWYCGHPDAAAFTPQLDHASAVVVGAGNVALDVARVLARKPGEMAETDVPDPVLDALRASAITDVHILVRRGPEHVKFTSLELRQIGELDGVQVVVHDDGVLAGALGDSEDRRVKQNLRLLSGWSAEPGPAAARRIHLHFLRTPLRVLARDGRVDGIVVGRNGIVDGRVVATGGEEILSAGLLVRAIGYAGEPVPGLPYDEIAGIVPNQAGRVFDGDRRLEGSYVTGWLKRGPVGVIGTNKEDAAETVASLLEDLDDLPKPDRPGLADALGLMRDHGLDVVNWDDWERLDAEELRLGGVRGCQRVKVAEMAAMLAACRSQPTEGVLT